MMHDVDHTWPVYIQGHQVERGVMGEAVKRQQCRFALLRMGRDIVSIFIITREVDK